MSFFETASLVLISDFAAASASAVSGSGANTGKAYSVKPTDGSGDFTFERGSDITATRVNKDGYIEKGRGNFLLQSNNFDTTWSQSGTTRTSGQSGYDGSSDAWEIARDGAAGLAFVYQTISSTGVQTFSLYAKANTEDWIYLQDTATGGGGGYFDLANGTAGTTSSIDSSIDSVGDGWYRIQIVSNRTTSGNIRIFVASANANLTVTGSIYIQDAQLEQGLVATDVIETTTAPLRAGLLEDEPRFDYHNSASASPSPSASLLLEPSRTNLITNSEYLQGWHSDDNVSYSVNNATSPEGLANAYKVTTTSTVQCYFRDFATLPSAGNYTFSIFAKYESSQYIAIRTDFFTGGTDSYCYFDVQNGTKGTNVGDAPVDYDIEDYGNGWYRCFVVHSVDAGDLTGFQFVYLTDTDGATTSTIGDEAYFYGGQWEEGSYPTSYIPTYGTSDTRGADSMQSDTSLFGITNEFTLFIDTNGALVDGTSLNQMDDLRWYTQSTNRYRFYKSSDAIFISNNIQVDDRTKIALKITASECKTFVNGVLDSTISLPTSFASFDSISRNMETKVKDELNQILLFPTALSNTDCEILTGATTYSSFAAMASALNYTVYE